MGLPRSRPSARHSPACRLCDQGDRYARREQLHWIYFLLFLFNAICYLDRINMSVAGRSVAQEFALSPVALGYLFSSFLWAYVVMMLPSGRLVDSLGAHRMAAIGAAVWSIAQMLSGAAIGFV